MPGISPCSNVPFVGTQQFEIPYGTTIASLGRPKANHFTLTVCRRPFLPLFGVKENAAPLANTFDFVPSTKGNENALFLIGQAAYEASINWVLHNNVAVGFGGNNFFTPNPPYPGYTYDRINADQCLVNRYNEVHSKAEQFFRLHAAIAAFDIALWKELHNELIPDIMREIDKQMFIPPGVYSFDGTSGSAAGTALQTWQTADPTFVRLFGIELITTS